VEEAACFFCRVSSGSNLTGHSVKLVLFWEHSVPTVMLFLEMTICDGQLQF
jgi:hypothetical protein